MNISTLKNHPCLTATSEIKHFCQSLKQSLKITKFCYHRLFYDNTEIMLSNDAEWTEHYHQYSYSLADLFLEDIEGEHIKYAVWKNMSKKHDIVINSREFNFHHGISIANFKEDYCELVGFATTIDNPTVINQYINHLDLLNNFILSFDEKFSNIFLAADKEKLLSFKPRERIKNEMELNLLRFNHAEFRVLTQKEKECIGYLITDYTSKNIAKRMDISPRTVEAHLANIKKKLQCYSKSDIIRAVL